jgi:DUF4097 and DUF4098 domain-containing protein YvlB
MKKVMLICFCFILSCLPVFAADIVKEFKVPIGKRLEMELKSGGSINIVGWEKELVTVEVDLMGRDADDCKVDFDQTESGIRIYSRCAAWRNNHSSSLHFEIKIPKRFDLDFDSMGGGVSISGVEGRIAGKTMGGELDLTQLKGMLDLRTMGGSITLTKSDVDGEVQTNDGKVLFEDVTGNVKGHSMGGAVTYRNVTDRAGKSTGKEVRISTMGGEINVQEATNGADVSTMGGDVKIRSAKEYVKAKTMGGNIHIDAIDGWVRAETMGGDVEVTMVGDPAQGRRDVDLSSKGGDITLTVPEGLSMEVDITVAYTRNARKTYRIISDFDLHEEESRDWDYDQGTPRRYIYATGSIAGGKNRIRIETINGDVYLKAK